MPPTVCQSTHAHGPVGRAPAHAGREPGDLVPGGATEHGVVACPRYRLGHDAVLGAPDPHDLGPGPARWPTEVEGPASSCRASRRAASACRSAGTCGRSEPSAPRTRRHRRPPRPHALRQSCPGQGPFVARPCPARPVSSDTGLVLATGSHSRGRPCRLRSHGMGSLATAHTNPRRAE